jgi:hypothetical protein
MNWKNLPVSVSESVIDELRLRDKYLVVENYILRNQIEGLVQSRMCEGTLSRRSQLLLYEVSFFSYPLSEYIPCDHPDPLTPERARVVYVYPIHSRQYGMDRFEPNSATSRNTATVRRHGGRPRRGSHDYT